MDEVQSILLQIQQAINTLKPDESFFINKYYSDPLLNLIEFNDVDYIITDKLPDNVIACKVRNNYFKFDDIYNIERINDEEDNKNYFSI